jgi:hypothetical protein
MMDGRFQFSLRRIILSTTLIAIGAAAFPMARLAAHCGEYESTVMVCCMVSFFALPGAGVGFLWGRPLLGVIAGLALGVALFLFKGSFF